MSLDPQVLAELRAQSTKREEAPLRDRHTALEARLARVESALAGCARYDEKFGKTIAMLLKESGIKTMAGRLDKLEARSGFKYVGVFKEGRTYEPDQFCTFHGGIWHCNSRTMTPPGNGAAAWTLACKAGRDGRDAAR